jgi:hypothetical protein
MMCFCSDIITAVRQASAGDCVSMASTVRYGINSCDTEQCVVTVGEV